MLASRSVAGARTRAGGDSVKGIVAAVLGLMLALLGGEAVVRASAHLGVETWKRIASRDPLAMVYEPFGNFGYRPRPGKTERYFNGTKATFNRLGYRGPVVPIDKPAGRYRIVLLGGSTAAGFGVNDDETIDAHMRRVLTRDMSGDCVDVVNLAVGGYDSYQDYERMRVDGMRLAPDLVVVHSGINDVRNAQFRTLTYPPDPKTLIWEPVMQTLREEQQRGPGLWTLMVHYSYLARIPGFVSEFWQQRQAVHRIHVSQAYDAAVDYFEINVTKAAELAFDSRAAVILSTPPSALSVRNRPLDPPERSYWIKDAGTTEQYRRRLSQRMEEIARRLKAAGHRVSYVSHSLPADQFLDDAHLTARGNATVAGNLVRAAAPYLPWSRCRSE